MAAQLGGKANGRGRYRPLAEINVTPLVDVMLVLLIVFMVAAPLMTAGVQVDLPKTNARPLNQDSEPITVSVNAEGKIYLQEQEVETPELVAKLQAAAQNNAERRIFVRADKGLNYGRVMEVMATITQGGFSKVALLAEQAAAAPAAAPASSRPAARPPATPPARPATPARPSADRRPGAG
jgi:biopolymer transport protein TolR